MFLSYLITAILVAMSGLFSGLNLGLLSLRTSDLKRKADLGDPDARRVLPIRERGNQLLTTLLLGNVAVNAAISIFLADISSGLVGGIVSTILIVIFGEIVPQSVFSRHALKFSARTATFTNVYLILLAPVAYPIGKLLDYYLGEELPQVYTKDELQAIIREHEENPSSTIDSDEEDIVVGALTFSNKMVMNVMTPRSMVFALPGGLEIDAALEEKIKERNFTRIPVYQDSIDNIIGILNAKDLIGVDDGEGVLVETLTTSDFIRVHDNERLDNVYNELIDKRIHMACVINKFGEFVGVVTLEDIIEEILQKEVYDENDPVHDPRYLALKHGRRIMKNQ